MCLRALWCLTLCDSLDCSPPGSSVFGISPGKNTGVGCHFFFQGIFSTQGSNLSLALQVDSFPLSHQGSPVFYGIRGQNSKCAPRDRAGRTGHLWGRHQEGGCGGGGQWPDGLGLSLDHPVSSAAGGFVSHPPPHPPASCPAGTMLSLLSEVCAVLEEVMLEGVIHASAEHSSWDSVCCVLSRVRLFAPTRLPCPWNSPGKNAGVAGHFLLLGQGRCC